MTHFATQLSVTMIAAGVTQAQLARLTRISNTELHRMRKGEKKTMSDDKKSRIIGAFKQPEHRKELTLAAAKDGVVGPLKKKVRITVDD